MPSWVFNLTEFSFRVSADAPGSQDIVLFDNPIMEVTMGGGVSTEANTTYTTYNNVDGDYERVENISVKIEIDSYNPSASVSNANRDPDLQLELWNSTNWIHIGNFTLNETYTGTSLDTTNNNFTLSTIDSTILTYWQNMLNDVFKPFEPWDTKMPANKEQLHTFVNKIYGLLTKYSG